MVFKAGMNLYMCNVLSGLPDRLWSNPENSTTKAFQNVLSLITRRLNCFFHKA